MLTFCTVDVTLIESLLGFGGMLSDILTIYAYRSEGGGRDSRNATRWKGRSETKDRLDKASLNPARERNPGTISTKLIRGHSLGKLYNIPRLTTDRYKGQAKAIYNLMILDPDKW